MKHISSSNWLARVGTGVPVLAAAAMLALFQASANAIPLPPSDPAADPDLDGLVNSADLDDDADGVLDVEDKYPYDQTKYQDGWTNYEMINIQNGLPIGVAGTSPIATMWDGSAIWSVQPGATPYMQVTWGSGVGGWQNKVFNTHQPVKLSGNIATDSAWNIAWYVGVDEDLYATYLSGSWINLKIATGGHKISRIHCVDPVAHAVWARTTNFEDIVIYWDSTSWKSLIIPDGGTIAWSGLVSWDRGLVGWDPSGKLFQRRASTAWTPEAIIGAGSIGPVGGIFGQEDTRYAVDAGRRLVWYGTESGTLGWTYMATSSTATGELPLVAPGVGYPNDGSKVVPFSPTYASSGVWFTFCLDGYLDKDKVRVFWYAANKWNDTPVGEYRGFAGDQAACTSAGRLFYVNVATHPNPNVGTPTLEYLFYTK